MTRVYGAGIQFAVDQRTVPVSADHHIGRYDMFLAILMEGDFSLFRGYAEGFRFPSLSKGRVGGIEFFQQPGIKVQTA